MARGRNRKRDPAEAKSPAASPEAVRRALLEVDEEVDLHGLAVDEALVQAELALDRYRGRPGAVLRFIHGHSTGLNGSIKGALMRRLEGAWKARTASHRPEPGNPGATLVKLR